LCVFRAPSHREFFFSSVLLFQDIAVIPILAFTTIILGHLELSNDAPQSLITGYQGWLQTVIVFGILRQSILVAFVCSVVTNHCKTRLQELFTASALLLVVGVSYMMQLIGLSPFWRIYGRCRTGKL
jgi:CPA2 family monovalent cation:H+ antiporter-2